MRPASVIVETADVLSSNTRYIGTMQIIITDNGNENISYYVPGCVYDPETPINLIGIPFLRDYFGSKDKIPNLDDDGTWIKSSAKKSHLTWDHSKYEQDFMHRDSNLTEMYLYQGQGHFQEFCSQFNRFLRDKVHFDFL